MENEKYVNGNEKYVNKEYENDVNENMAKSEAFFKYEMSNMYMRMSNL